MGGASASSTSQNALCHHRGAFFLSEIGDFFGMWVVIAISAVDGNLPPSSRSIFPTGRTEQNRTENKVRDDYLFSTRRGARLLRKTNTRCRLHALVRSNDDVDPRRQRRREGSCPPEGDFGLAYIGRRVPRRSMLPCMSRKREEQQHHRNGRFRLVPGGKAAMLLLLLSFALE